MTTDTAVIEESPRKRWRRWVILAVLTLIVLLNAFIAFWLFWTGKPAAQLPVVRALTRNQPPHFLFSIYGVQRPLGVAVSPDGQRIYVVEGGGDRLVRIFSRSGKPLGSLPPPSEQFGMRSPRYVTVDPQGEVYVSDRINLKVLVYSPQGELIDEIGDPEDGGTWAPLGLSVGPAGELYVTEASVDGHRIVVFDSLGEPRAVFGEEGEEPGQILFANGVIADDKGRIFVSNGNNGRIDVFAPDGTYLESVSGSDAGALALPRGMALDDLGRLYVVDTVNQNVVVFDVEGPRPKFLFSFGGYGIGDGQWRYPVGIAVDGSARVYVTDRVNNRIQVWSY
jgi:DNA-binding beta-propeller fold protein YncE